MIILFVAFVRPRWNTLRIPLGKQDLQDYYSFVTSQKKVTKLNPADGGKINIDVTELILINT